MFGEKARETLVAGQRVLPRRLLDRRTSNSVTPTRPRPSRPWSEEDLAGDLPQVEVRGHAPAIGPGAEDGQDVAAPGQGHGALPAEDVARLAQVPGHRDPGLVRAVDLAGVDDLVVGRRGRWPAGARC
ncbi:MAG: hypothetical protein M0C28_35680 [Candidatus Moduliflexus flocculans]|nr:hypothetical protein [Candidatus Moduliflexus flocculans]